jgi:hypothetical protein
MVRPASNTGIARQRTPPWQPAGRSSRFRDPLITAMICEDARRDEAPPSVLIHMPVMRKAWPATPRRELTVPRAYPRELLYQNEQWCTGQSAARAQDGWPARFPLR